MVLLDSADPVGQAVSPALHGSGGRRRQAKPPDPPRRNFHGSPVCIFFSPISTYRDTLRNFRCAYILLVACLHIFQRVTPGGDLVVADDQRVSRA